MLVAFALVVSGASIAVFFADELGAMAKKIAEVPGVKLLLPLMLLSWFLELYQEDSYLLLLSFRAHLEQWMNRILMTMPVQVGAMPVIKILYLNLLACLPPGLYWLGAKRKNIPMISASPYRWAILLWIVGAILLTVELT